MDPYATHMPLLLACVAATSGPVLELGCGDYSTPTLHLLCKNRMLVSADSDGNWCQRFIDLSSENHRVFLVGDWACFSLIDQKWDVAFVDHGPVERRKHDIERLMKQARFVVVHDTEDTRYQYESALSRFKHRFDYKRLTPWTTVVSNEPIDFV
jgi:hypothetical protein